jgi:uncharacterized membrane protein YphA (DoxX/SURF4 family)
MQIGDKMLTNFAHIKWFVDSNEILKTPVEPYPWSITQVALLVLIAVIVISIGVYIERLFPEPPKKFLKKVNSIKPLIMRIFTVLIGLFLVVIGIFWSIVLAPEVSANANIVTQILRVIQIVCGVQLISGYKPTISAKLLAGLFLVTGLFAGPVFYAENILLLGSSMFIYTFYTESKPFKKKWSELALPVLRVTTGISLIAFALSEKLVHPELSQVFLGEHNWNMFSSFLSDNAFIITAGLVEVIFGLLFVFGIATRIATISIASLFATSVVTMLVTKGQWEVEDLPVYAVAIVLIAYGSGTRLRLNKSKLKSK